MRARAKDNVSAVDDYEVISTPLRIDFDNPGRKRMEAHRRRDCRADRNVEVDVSNFFDPLLFNGGSNLSLLFSRGCCGR